MVFKSQKQHINYWKYRKNINWKEAYFDSYEHPHRFLIIEALKKMRFGSVFEIGCAAGANLFLIKKNFLDARIGGIDLNEDAIKTAKQLLPRSGVLETGNALDIFLSDKSVDVVLTDMTFIYINPLKIHEAIEEIKRICRNNLIMIEFHSGSFLKRWGLRLATGYNAYDYKKLLEKHEFYDVEIEKLKEKDWPGGEPQRTYGYLITAKL